MSSSRERPGSDQGYAQRQDYPEGQAYAERQDAERQAYAERAARYEQETGYPMDPAEARRVTADAGGVGVWTGRVLAGFLLILNGLMAFAAGISVIRNPSFVTFNSNYLIHWTTRGWGWTELGIGIALFATGVCVLLGMAWARWVAIVVAALAAVGSFMFLPFFPLWAIVIIAINVFIIWALAAGGMRSRVT